MNGWKITAIIFIVLFILETISFLALITIGYSALDKEARCSNDICGGSYGSYDSFYYDSSSQMCYCFIKGEVSKKESMK